MDLARTSFGALLWLLAFHAASAEIYRCERNGAVSYTDRACKGEIRRVVREHPRPSVEQIVAARERLHTQLQAYAVERGNKAKHSAEESCCCEVTTSVKLRFDGG